MKLRSSIPFHSNYFVTVTQGNRMHKYADDTYISIPACNDRTREVELDHVALLAHENNLKFNRAKSTEIVFTESRRESQFSPRPTHAAGCKSRVIN